MSDQKKERLYFIAESGPVLEALEKAFKTAQERQKRNLVFQRIMGAIGVWKDWRGPVHGLLYPMDVEVPEGMRCEKTVYSEDRDVRVMVPRRSVKAGKELAKHPAFNEPVWELQEFYDLVGRAMTIQSNGGLGMTLANPGVETIDGKLVVSVPDDGTPYEPPEGMVPLKMSEYWAMKEKAGETA